MNKVYPFDHESIGFVDLIEEPSIKSELKVVNSARISYNSVSKEYSEKDRKLAGFLWNHEHTSPFRHSYYTFHIKAPLSVFRQWVKYQVGSTWRTYEVVNSTCADNTVCVNIFDLMFDTDKGCSWNEVSRRYVVVNDEYYLPKELRSNPPHGNKQSSGVYVNPLDPADPMYLSDPLLLFKENTERCLDTYRRLIANGVAKEQARNVLPDNIYSEAYWTVSLQAVLHFLAQRTKPDAQFEIRSYANCIKSLLSDTLNSLNINHE